MKKATFGSLAAVLGLAALVGGLSPVAAGDAAAADVAALEGGTALPEGAWTISFPWHPKQSIAIVSDAEIERMAGLVKFDAQGRKPLGSVTLDGKGGGTGSFAVRVADVTTGVPGRDEHMRSGQWLDAEKFPDITYTVTKLERVQPTVWRVTGAWKMHGVEKEVVSLANVRFFEKMDHFDGPNGVARLKTRLTLSLKAFGVDNPFVGSPAVADAWDVELVLLGSISK